MTKNSRVIWSEGLFLQPQHLQQQERFLLSEIHARQGVNLAHPEGFECLEFDQDLLRAGQLQIKRARGFFPDGAFFSIPDKDPAPPCLPLPVLSQPAMVYLCLPTPHWNAVQLAWSEHEQNPLPHRLCPVTLNCQSVYDEGLEEEAVQVAVLNLKLSVGSELEQGFVRLGVACLVPASKNTHATLDPDYVPPSLNLHQVSWLTQKLEALLGLLSNKALTLQGRRLRKGSHNTTELGDFLLLQSCIRHRLALSHLQSIPLVHPERLYMQLLACLGDVCMHGDDTAMQFTPNYQHHDLKPGFEALFGALNKSLSGLNDQHALQIPLQAKPGGVYLGQISDKALLQQAYFYITVHALAPEELVQRTFPTTVKIGPVERLRDLVNLNLPGVRLKHLNHFPPAMPYYADHLVFQLETRGETLWQQLETTGHLAIHFAGDLPELRLELWAVRKMQEKVL
ncbi:type VI secretion system baseplate subunit TssK [Limnobacter sp.]|uniref:type VI secretion system baseplate subunit TssK n=1 Tax=Limnobacter sp. TaxID=2003368 RepID=UPI003511884D